MFLRWITSLFFLSDLAWNMSPWWQRAAGTQGLSACEGRAHSAPEHIWTTEPFLSCWAHSVDITEVPVLITLHSPVMTLNTRNTQHKCFNKFTGSGHLCWLDGSQARHWVSFLLIPVCSFSWIPQHFVMTKTSTQTFHALVTSRRLQTAVVRLWPWTRPVILEPFCCDYRSSSVT